MFDEPDRTFRHFKVLVNGPSIAMKQFFVSSSLPFHAMDLLSTVGAADAVGIHDKSERLVPMFLFFGEKEKRPPAFDAFPSEIEVVEDWHWRERLPFEIGFDSSPLDLVVGSVGGQPIAE